MHWLDFDFSSGATLDWPGKDLPNPALEHPKYPSALRLIVAPALEVEAYLAFPAFNAAHRGPFVCDPYSKAWCI